MKRPIARLLLPLLLAGCSHLRESDRIGPEIRGDWVGEGHFYDRDLAAEYGNFPVRLEVHDDDSVTGTLGAARLERGVVRSRPEDYIVRAELAGPVFPGGSLPAEEKDCAIFLLQPRGDAIAGADVHLKTDFGFDFSMRVGGPDLAREVSPATGGPAQPPAAAGGSR